ncbi:MAG: type II secretion system protein [Armatimonadota bacterium]
MRNRRGFTLIEMLVVVGIIAVLAAIIFPVYAQARGKARQAQCTSNLRQLGQAHEMYSSDHDELYPFAIDAADEYAPQIWDGFPQWQAWIPYMDRLENVLQPYTKSREVFHCAGDTGYDHLENTPYPIPGEPTAFGALGSSYHWRTEVAFEHLGPSLLAYPAQTNLMMDGHGSWHGGRSYAAGRWNILYADGHVKNVNAAQFDEAWFTPVK